MECPIEFDDYIEWRKRYSRFVRARYQVSTKGKTAIPNYNSAFWYFCEENEKYDSKTKCEILRYYSAENQVLRRLKNKIAQMLLSGRCYFLSLTFTDLVLESTSPEWRRKLVTYWLKDNTEMYVANKDYGKKYKREHYHAVVKADYIDISGWLDRGAMKWGLVEYKSPDTLRKYMYKLSNHGVKHNTDGLIYSRKKRSETPYTEEWLKKSKDCEDDLPW